MVDEDGSLLSRRIHDALLPPRFLPPAQLTVQEIDAVMDTGRYTFVIDIPPDFQADVVRGRRPAIQINVDATAMTQAGTGAGYIQSIIAQELTAFLGGTRSGSQAPGAPGGPRQVQSESRDVLLHSRDTDRQQHHPARHFFVPGVHRGLTRTLHGLAHRRGRRLDDR